MEKLSKTQIKILPEMKLNKPQQITKIPIQPTYKVYRHSQMLYPSQYSEGPDMMQVFPVFHRTAGVYQIS